MWIKLMYFEEIIRYMSINYVKGSLKNLDKDGDGVWDHVEFKLVNQMGSGGVLVENLKILIDGEDVTAKTYLTVGGGRGRIKESMYVYSMLGEEITFEVEKEGGLSDEPHEICLKAKIGWEEMEIKFKAKPE